MIKNKIIQYYTVNLVISKSCGYHGGCQIRTQDLQPFFHQSVHLLLLMSLFLVRSPIHLKLGGRNRTRSLVCYTTELHPIPSIRYLVPRGVNTMKTPLYSTQHQSGQWSVFPIHTTYEVPGTPQALPALVKTNPIFMFLLLHKSLKRQNKKIMF